MNPKPLKDWSYEELMTECVWLIIESITEGTRLISTMYRIDTLTDNWRREIKWKEQMRQEAEAEKEKKKRARKARSRK